MVAVRPAVARTDLGLLGGLWSMRAAAVAYDLTHTYALPAAMGVVGVVTGSGLAIALALVWFAHIGMDRALGLGSRTRTVPDAPTSGAFIRSVVHGEGGEVESSIRVLLFHEG
jgi:hypothetical protein